LQADITKYDFGKECVDEFFLDNVLEHFSFDDAHHLLVKLKKALVQNGKLIIIVPEFEKLTEAILALSPADLLSAKWFKYNLLGVGDNLYNTHKSFYSKEIMKYVLNFAGFKIVEAMVFPYPKQGCYHLKVVCVKND